MKTKTIYAFLIFNLFLFTACNDKTDFKQKFIEENFLQIVDTNAYLTGSFRKPPDSLNKKTKLDVEQKKPQNGWEFHAFPEERKNVSPSASQPS